MQEKEPQNQMQEDLKPLYARSVVNSFGSGMVNPFVGAYAVQLGASSSDMGWFQSSSNLSSNLMQVFWARLSDKLKQRIPFIVFGTVVLSVLWVPMMFVANATQLIIILAIQALIGSMATPAWTALIGDLVPSMKLGRANASINIWASLGGVLATLGSGMLMVSLTGTIQQVFFLPLIIAIACGIASSLVMLRIKEKKNGEKINLKEHLTSDIFNVLEKAKKTPDFLKYCYAVAAYEFFMSIAWPLFSIIQVRVMNASMLQIAVISVVQTLPIMAFQRWAGRLADTIGRRPLLIFFRFAFVTVPLAYAFVTDINLLIVIGIFWGFAQALGSASVTAYLLDVSPEELRGSFIAVFNLIMGVVTFFGSLIGGYLSDYTIGIFGMTLGLQIVLLLSVAGRTAGAVFHLRLQETLKR